jgi:hypothetical protein
LKFEMPLVGGGGGGVAGFGQALQDETT